jgi:F0F1-type ATP synthase membrane subunit a
MACRHFGNILSGTVISTLIYAALTAANNIPLGAKADTPESLEGVSYLIV